MTDIRGKEIISTFDFNQFQPHQSVDQCGPAAVSLTHFAGEPGKAAQGTPQEAIALMEQLYTKFIGPDVPDDFNGTSLATLYEMIVSQGNHFQNLYPDGGVDGTTAVKGKIQAKLKDYIGQWVQLGYPVILAVTEDSVYDMELKKKPYGWNTSGLTHILTVSGVTSSGIDYLVRDTANVIAPGPRTYASWQLQIISATVIVPGIKQWLPRPKSTNPADMQPPAPPPTPPTPPTPPQPTKAELEAKIKELQVEMDALITQLVTMPDSVTQATTN